MKDSRLMTFAFLLILSLSLGSHIQMKAKQEESFYPYWHQRASLFEVLPNTKNEIIFLGDSITDGNNWGEMFQDVRVKNRGISGDVTDGILERLDEVIESRPLKIFLMIGINDLAEGRTEDYVTSKIRRIVGVIKKKSPDTEIYLQSLLPVNKDFGMFKNYTNKTAEILAVNQGLKAFSSHHQITFVDLYSAFVCEGEKLNPKYTNDGLHLTGAGYLAWKSTIDEYIK
jgi:lysophospholipase L1-like esterase